MIKFYVDINPDKFYVNIKNIDLGHPTVRYFSNTFMQYKRVSQLRISKKLGDQPHARLTCPKLRAKTITRWMP
jgi:hypothetical protein